ncbi:hypothetical protein G647_06164 [Cladophialophora carrionii CBS 160.54]|uniref:Transmembrane protein n=1 Tax=Cladophialophora carrionii CBS 160.54 TaxID=1279043 RepID=V9D727_9EURO|nr:uncharacterized protein G647_06164 [Cladophialophora carrionii CBS 160.54]ETI22093.1 hypothetical protein G647_06164 [Cladophialophora carrionii CBS 160.54]
MSTSHQHPPKPSLPKFEPLPPTNILNRVINGLLAPLFYLFFTLITSIVVVPVYVIIDNFKHGGGKHGGGKSFAKHESEQCQYQYQYPGQPPQRTNKASTFLREYGRSHSAATSKDD